MAVIQRLRSGLSINHLLYATNFLLRAMTWSDSFVVNLAAITKSRDRSRSIRLVSKRVLVVDSGIAGPPQWFGFGLPVLRTRQISSTDLLEHQHISHRELKLLVFGEKNDARDDGVQHPAGLEGLRNGVSLF